MALANPKLHNSSAPKGSLATLDPLGKPIPGESLTTAPNENKWSWEQPPEYVEVDDALAFVIKNIETDPDSTERIERIMYSGTPIETLVNTITFAGFTDGKWSPDLAELMKPPLAAYFILKAMEQNIPIRVFNNKPSRNMLSDNQVIESMHGSNPNAFRHLKESVNSMTTADEEKSFGDMTGDIEGRLPDDVAQEVQMELPVNMGEDV